jgi:hypothetical protein
VKISDCRDYVVVSHESTTTVVKLPVELLRRNHLSSPLSHLLNPTTNEASQLTHLGSTNVAAFGLKRGQVLTNTSCIVSSSGETAGHILENRGGDKPSIRLMQIGANSDLRSLELIQLPLSGRVEHTTLTALMPKTGEDSLKVLINSKSQTEYSMKDESDHYPALIERKMDEIKYITRKVQRREQRTELYVSGRSRGLN